MFCCPNYLLYINLYMGSRPFFNQFKKNATSFMLERYKDARILLTDTTEAEMLAEEVTNNEPCNPDERKMSRIAEASYNIDDYWRIVDVLHNRLYRVDWRYWRRSYKSLVLLDFLLSHGPEEFSAEFDEQMDAIKELGSFKHTDKNRIDWGRKMRKNSERVLELLKGGETLIQARLKAINTSKEIHVQGFGNISISSPLPSSSPSSSTSSASFSSLLLLDTPSSSGSSFCIRDSATSSSSGGGRNLAGGETSDVQAQYEYDDPYSPPAGHGVDVVEETGNSSSSEVEDEERKGKRKGKRKVYSGIFMGGLCSKLGIHPRGNGQKFGLTTTTTPNDAEMSN